MENQKEPQKEWQDNYGQTLVKFGPKKGEVEITERKTGEKTKRTEKPVETIYDKLSEPERDWVNTELRKFEEESKKYMSAKEITDAYGPKQEELSRKILEPRKENKK